MEPPSGDGGDDTLQRVPAVKTTLQWSRRRVTAETHGCLRLQRVFPAQLQWSRRRVTAETRNWERGRIV